MSAATAGGRIDIVTYDDRWVEAQQAFARRNWPGKARRADPDYLRWEYRGPQHGPVPELLLAVDGDVVVGQLGRIPGQARIGGELVPIGWIGNLMVEPDYRRRGVSSDLVRAIIELPGMTLGTDPSPAAAKMLEAFGFGETKSSELFVLPLKAGPVLAVRYPVLARAARVIDVVGRPAVSFLTRKLRAAQDDDRAQVCTWTDVVGLVANSEADTSVNRSVHDEDFLRWRCGGFRSWVRETDVIRTPAGSFAIVEQAGHRLLVLHWSAVNEAEAVALLGRVAYVAESYGMDFVQAMGSTSEESAILSSVGFQRRRTPTVLVFHPPAGIGAEGFRVQGYDTDQNL